MLPNRVTAMSAGLLGSAVGLGIPRLEVDFFGAEQIQPLFSPFQPHQEDLMKRDGSCGSGMHPCSDINSTLCCQNTQYCSINEVTFQAQCCDLDSTCGNTCGQDSYYSVVIITSTVGGTATTGTAGACVGRPCTGTNYQCPENMGGNCCAFGQDCQSLGVCLQVETASIMSVCTSGLFACGMVSQETICCPTGAACTSASPSGYYCLSSIAAQPAIPTATPAAADDPSNGDDSVALKVGLGVGIPAGVITIAVIVFAWRIRRAKKQRNQRSGTDPKQGYSKPELAADSIAVPVELDTGAPELPAQILEAELPEEGIVAELPGGAPSQTVAQPSESRRS